MSEHTEAHAECYPCRPLPKAEEVKNAVPEPKGTAKKCADKQVGENRLPLNSHVEKTQKL